MSEERLTILRMLSEKKITVEEAEKLLNAIESPSRTLGVSHLFRDLGQSFQKFQYSEAIHQVVHETLEQLKNTVAGVGSLLEGTDQDQQFQIAPETELQIRHGGGNLLIHRSEGDQLVLSGTRRGCTMDAEKNRVAVTSGGGNLAVGVPANVTALDVSTGGGNVSVRGLELRQFKARSAGGNLHLAELEAPEIHVSSMGGHIELRRPQTRDLHAKSVGGNIHVALESPEEGRVDLHSIGGRIELRLPEEAHFKVSAETLGGRFSSDFELQGYQSFGGRTEGQVGEGGMQIRLQTKGGDAYIRKVKRPAETQVVEVEVEEEEKEEGLSGEEAANTSEA